MMNLEKRGLAAEIRAKGRRLEGYAATFNNPAVIGGAFSETIAPGAFSGSLRSGRDVLALVDHDPGRVLARTRSHSLRLGRLTHRRLQVLKNGVRISAQAGPVRAHSMLWPSRSIAHRSFRGAGTVHRTLTGQLLNGSGRSTANA
ncbi:HK97 family phage prohead protease [uncultured Martelella sp.]|uniref:HK97 family phage prohead protease n=1 Tax=uncultured Martelella sp. TaxID=392331 RepID=UPI0029C618A8|nr:HK97 family phage prohead protease [uncultured Martelella sp.]